MKPATPYTPNPLAMLLTLSPRLSAALRLALGWFALVALSLFIGTAFGLAAIGARFGLAF